MDQSHPFLEVPHMDIQWDIDNRWEQMANRLNEQRVHRPRRIVVLWSCVQTDSLLLFFFYVILFH